MHRRAFTVVALVLAAVLPSRSATPARKPRALPGDPTMMKRPAREHKSIILRSTHILLVRVVAAKPSAWAPAPPGFESRRVELSLEIVEVLRGKLEPAPAGPVTLQVVQFDYAGLLMMQPLPGLWSRIPVEPGTELVAFARSTSARAERILEEPALTRAQTAMPVLPGLRVAVKTLADNRPLHRALELATSIAPQLDQLFAEFLWDRYGDEAVASQADFDLLADFTEKKGLQQLTRLALLDGGDDLVSRDGDETPGRVRRLALTMFRVLLMPEAADLRENLIRKSLPNLLGIASSLPAQPAAKVFAGRAEERAAVEAFLRHHGTDADATPLLAWLGVE